MRNNLKIIILYFFLGSHLFSQDASFDFSYERKTGDGKSTDSQGNISDENYSFHEEFLRINSNYGNNFLYLELEYSSSPVLGYPKTKFEDIISRFYLEHQFDIGQGKIGHIYTLYGAGLGLYTFSDQATDFDNSLKGLEFRGFLGDYIEPFIILGKMDLEQRTNPAIPISDRLSDNTVFVSGFNYDFPLGGYGHFLYKNQESIMDVNTVRTFWIEEGNRTTLLDWYIGDQFEDASLISVGDTLNTESFNLGYGISTSWGDIYFEGEWLDYTQLLGDKKKGRRYYISLGTNIGNTGLSYEFKNYDAEYDILTFSTPPTVAIQTTSILAARNTHSMNFGDETGHQFEIIKPISDNLNFSGNLSIAGRRKAKNETYLTSGTENLFTFLEGYQYEDIASMDDLSQADANLIAFYSNFTTLSATDLTTSVTENNIVKPSFTEYLSFDATSDNFKAFYPYRQIYGEVNGYISDNVYIKIGYDLYNEVIKHKDQVAYQNTEDLNSASNTFIDQANATVQNMSDFASGLGLDFETLLGISTDDYLAQFPVPEESVEESYTYMKAWTIPTQLTYILDEGNSTTFYLEHQSKTESLFAGDNDYISTYFSGSYAYKGLWSFTLFYENEDIEYFSGFIKSDYWRGYDLSFDLEDKGQLSIFYGSQKGGRVCANGICADQPGFEDGIKVTYRTFF